MSGRRRVVDDGRAAGRLRDAEADGRDGRGEREGGEETIHAGDLRLEPGWWETRTADLSEISQN